MKTNYWLCLSSQELDKSYKTSKRQSHKRKDQKKKTKKNQWANSEKKKRKKRKHKSGIFNALSLKFLHVYRELQKKNVFMCRLIES